MQVICEDPDSGEQTIATTVHLTLVTLDENNKPMPVPSAKPQTPLEKKRYEDA